MSEIRSIICRGRMAALVVGGQAIITDALPSREPAIVKAMCLYALEVADGRLPGPYSERERSPARAPAAAKAHLTRLCRSTAAHILLAQQRGPCGRRPGTCHLEAKDGKERTAMNIEQAIDEAAHASDARLRRSYEVALAYGATNTGCRPDEERLYGTLRLVTLALLRLPDLAMIAQLMHMDTEDRVVLRAACDVASGALRLAHRALETHGRDVGYQTGAWIDDTLVTAAAELAREHDEAPVLIEQVRLATLALTQAVAAIPEDRMLVPDRLAKSLRHLLVIYVIAERLDSATAIRSRQGDQR